MLEKLFKLGLAAIIALAASVQVYAQTVPISGLPSAATPLSGSELVPCVQGGVTKNCLARSIGAAISPVAITSGTIDGTAMGQTTPAAGAFTAISASSLAGVSTFPGSFGSTPTKAYGVNIGGFPPSSEIPGGVLHGLNAEVYVPSSYTGQPWPNTALSGYVVSANSAAGNSHVALYGFSGSDANGANPYGANVDVSNTNGVGTQTGCNCGHDFTFGSGFELDSHFMKKAGGSAPGGTYLAISILGDSEVSPTGYSDAIDIAAMGQSGTAPFSDALRIRPGATTGAAIRIDEASFSGPSASGTLKFISGTNGGTEFTSKIFSIALGSLEFIGANNQIDIPINGTNPQTLTLNGAPLTTTSISAKQFMNGFDSLYLVRSTDTSPTGRYLNFTNAAQNTTEFQVDVSGNTTGNGFANFTSYFVQSTPGYTGTKVAGACTIAVMGGLVTGITGC